MYNFVEQTPKEAPREFQRPLFPPEKRKFLEDFVDYALALNDTSVVRNWDKIKVSIHFGNDGRITNNGSLPTDEEMDSFLHRYRPFYLNNEPTNFNRITNLLSEHFKDPWITRLTRKCKQYYDGAASRELCNITAGGMCLNSNKFLDDYLNALEYHRDSSRRKNIDKIAEFFPIEAQKPVIVSLLCMRLNAINKITSFICTCFDREDGRVITLKSSKQDAF